jgi:hypothetical protein
VTDWTARFGGSYHQVVRSRERSQQRGTAVSDKPTKDQPDRAGEDIRLYLPFPEGWQARVKHGWEKEYCFQKNPGEDYFHLILNGEIYLENGDERYCLNCAFRRGVINHDRLNWQRGAKKNRDSFPL